LLRGKFLAMTGEEIRMKSYSKKARIMGIVNVTPDSFYDGGRYQKTELAIKLALKLVEEGADIIDIGGESSRPGAMPVSAKEELKRVIPVIKNLSKEIKIPISVDTYKSKVAEEALKNGAGMINDISALRMDENMVKVAREYDVPLILMHMQGTPRTMQKHPHYKDVITEIYQFLNNRIEVAEESGIKPNKIIIDPGIGFGKTTKHNLLIIKNLKKFKPLKKPILIGPSRKRFIGEVLDLPAEERLEGTLGVVAVALLNGAEIMRVHNVKETKRIIRIIEAISSE